MSMYLGQEIPILGDFFKLHFTENPGMAFGLEFGGNAGKLALTLFRIFAVIVISFIIGKLCKKKASFGLIAGLSLILAGAVGNIIDSLFYGVIFSESTFSPNNLATIFPESGGYGKYFHGKVVDMLHFTFFKGYWPDWIPFVGGNRLEFFRPIFNIADSAISLGIFYLLLFQRSFFTSNIIEEDKDANPVFNTDNLDSINTSSENHP